ncbi:CLUMA_CG007158, isoform A [Clunio marinus]|uniref:CLUMA_CG007158, isoform A n=1 Tax=Clunio marinus TaxID=568069 RepID=A0A1J1I215_9DIPT|nr:CLUMA_CG007158, isoform A [Clunio marinus]
MTICRLFVLRGDKIEDEMLNFQFPQSDYMGTVKNQFETKRKAENFNFLQSHKNGIQNIIIHPINIELKVVLILCFRFKL